MSTRALSILSIKSMLWSHNFQLRMLLEHTEHAVLLRADQHSTCHGSIAPASSASREQSFHSKQIQLNVLLVLTTIQLETCTKYIKLIQGMVLRLHPYEISWLAWLIVGLVEPMGSPCPYLKPSQWSNGTDQMLPLAKTCTSEVLGRFRCLSPPFLLWDVCGISKIQKCCCSWCLDMNHEPSQVQRYSLRWRPACHGFSELLCRWGEVLQVSLTCHETPRIFPSFSHTFSHQQLTSCREILGLRYPYRLLGGEKYFPFKWFQASTARRWRELHKSK